MVRARRGLAGWLAARRKSRAAFWPDDELADDELAGDKYMTELTGAHPVIARPPQPASGRHRRPGPPDSSISYEIGWSAENPRATSVPDHGALWGVPSAAGWIDLGQLHGPRHASGEKPYDEPLPAPAREPVPPARQGAPTIVFEVVRPNIASDLDPYLEGLPGYKEQPGS